MPKVELSEKFLKKIMEQFPEEFAKESINSLDKLIGQTLMFKCVNYFYYGTVKEVNNQFITLENASVVFETGGYEKKEAEDFQKLPHNAYVMIDSIEAFMKMNW
jgi:adenylosuccinate synthase